MCEVCCYSVNAEVGFAGLEAISMMETSFRSSAWSLPFIWKRILMEFAVKFWLIWSWATKKKLSEVVLELANTELQLGVKLAILQRLIKLLTWSCLGFRDMQMLRLSPHFFWRQMLSRLASPKVWQGATKGLDAQSQTPPTKGRRDEKKRKLQFINISSSIARDCVSCEHYIFICAQGPGERDLSSALSL